MREENVKEQLIDATIRLLRETKKPNSITARKIAETANANLAMINYYFKSKDELMSIAVDRLVKDSAKKVKSVQKKVETPKGQLVEFLIATSDTTFKYSELTKPVIPYLLLEGDIDLPYQILPLVNECFAGKKTEAECRTICFQLISFMQLVFYREEDFKKFSGIDISDESQRHSLYHMIVDNLIPEEK